MKTIALSLALAALASLAGCSTYPDGEPIYWGNFNKAMQDLNANRPRQTYCTRVDTDLYCQTY